MPNWCNNDITLKHSNPRMVERAYQALCRGELLEEFFPCPTELREHSAPERDEAQAQRFIEQFGAKDWYDWCVNNWGTKWDVGGDDGLTQKLDANTLQASFDSAWAPPTQAYEKLIELGFHVKAYYHEPGMCFCGVWEGDTENGFFDDYYEYSNESSATVREVVGEELDDYYGISEMMAEYEDENLDIDLDGGLSAVNEQDKE